MHRRGVRQVTGIRTSFGCSVSELPAACALHDTRYGGYVDDRRSVARRTAPALLQQGQESHCDEELGREVRLERFCPLFGLALHEMLRDGFGRGEIWRSGLGKPSIVISCDAGIVDEQMDSL